MLVIADSPPLIALIHIGHSDILPVLFGQVIIPTAVGAELSGSRRFSAVREFIAHRPPWLIERVPSHIEPIAMLHAGELAAISLARELKADLILMDETRGRKAAVERQIAVTGTVGVLELAAARGLLHLEVAFERLKSTDFWISNALLTA